MEPTARPAGRIGRRGFLKGGALAAAAGALRGAPLGLAAACRSAPGGEARPEPYRISLAQWSLHRALFGGEIENLDFPVVAREVHGFAAVEYVNQFFKDRAGDSRYLAELRRRADGSGVESLLIMIDGEGRLGEPDSARREQVVENHRKWLAAAAALGCHSIRVNAASEGSPEEQERLCADGCGRLAALARPLGLAVIVENHGGLSSSGAWLAGLMKAVGAENFGTLPDFGNWGSYDRYRGVGELMPWARAVSAKSYGFDDDGNETTIDYPRMMGIVADAGYRGWVGVEFEGREIPEAEGIRATRLLLERVRETLRG